MFDFVKPDEGPGGQDGHIIIMQIQQGKTSQHIKIWVRVMRNRGDVKMCPMGSTALYLFHRSEVTQEEFDFSENSKWSSRKLLVSSDTTTSFFEKEMLRHFYGKMLQQTRGELDVTTDRLQNFGLKYGPIYAEMQDIPIAKIEHLPNWSRSPREEAYSTKLPMKALRAMWGHEETKGGYFLARGAFILPEELQKQCSPFVDAALVKVNVMNNKGWKRVTACGFLNMLKIFWIVILQDAAELIGMGRGGHAVFQHKVFQSQLFIEWLKALRAGLKVDSPASNLALYNLEIDKAVKKLHHALRGGLQQCKNTTNVSTLKEGQDSKTVLGESIDRLITKESVGELFARGAELFHTKKSSGVTNHTWENSKSGTSFNDCKTFLRQSISDFHNNSNGTHHNHDTTTNNCSSTNNPSNCWKDIAIEQEVLPLTKEAESDEMIFELS
jgi:hypothetical protein